MKNQVKKSLSLLMAVLMILSCWVWVAPEKAEAYSVSEKYKVEIVVNVSNPCDAGHVTCNGTTVISSLPDSFKKEGTQTLSFESTSFPTTIFLRITTNAASTSKGEIKSISINGITVVSGSFGYNTTKVFSSGNDDFTFAPNEDGTSYGSGSNVKSGTWNWKKPAFAQIREISVSDEVEISKLPNGAAKTTTVSVKNGYDQYGVKFDGTVPSTLANDMTLELRTNETTKLDSKYGTIKLDKTKGTTATVTFNDDVQTLFPNAINGTVYAYATHKYDDHTITTYVPIKLTFPTYDITFHANGGKIGSSDSDGQDSITVKGIKYQGVIGKSPAYRAKAGFEFKGFYSVKNADANGLTPSFSGTLYKDSETTVTTQGDMTYYAAWQALPITATFMTADNQLIGTVKGRYNNYMTASNMYNDVDGLNAAVKAAHTSGKVKFNSNNEPIYTDGSTTYTFAGWRIIEDYDESVMDGNEDTVLKGDVTFQAVYTKADATKYTVSFEDGAGNVTSTKDDYLYRAPVIGVPESASKATDNKYSYEFIGWAKKLANVNYFAVDANDCDTDGVKLVYTHKDSASFVVKGDATYVPVFRMIPRTYKVTYNYTLDASDNSEEGTPASTVIEGFKWNDTPSMPEIKDNYTADGFRYFLLGWKVNGGSKIEKLENIAVQGDMILTAVYGNPKGAEYTINFYGKDETGEKDVLLEGSGIYEHNSELTAPEVPATINTEEAFYSNPVWTPSVPKKATADADYYAIYTKQTYADVQYYNYDGTELIPVIKGNFIDDIIPDYTGETPVKPEDDIGTYEFIGWNTDINGNGETVEPGEDKFEGDTHLYAQFKTNYKEYTVKFVNDVLDANGEQVVVSKNTYHYGDVIEIPANPKKDKDEAYEYEFRGWTPDVSDVCYGEATYTATYRRTLRYYTVNWLDHAKQPYTSANYAYNARINQGVIKADDMPVTPDGYKPADEGFKWVFDHWEQCEADGTPKLVDGKPVIFQRGQRMPAETLYFYPVFVQKANVLTVTFYEEDGETVIGSTEVAYGEKTIADIDEAFKAKAVKKSDATHHYTIKNWIIKDSDNVEAPNTPITESLSLVAKYTAEEHNKQIYEVVVEPTANVPGYAHYKCPVDECTSIDYNVAIAPVADEGKPTGQISVGDKKWTLGDFATIDYSEIKYVSANTQLIVNAKDTGTRSMPWNVEGELSRGVGKIEYIVLPREDKVDNVTTLTDGWTEIYNYEDIRQEALAVVLEENKLTLLDYTGFNFGDAEAKMKKAKIDRAVEVMLSGYKANATGIVSNLNVENGLENGKEYIIYIKVSDREGNGEVNSCIFSSGTISYGSNPATIEVSGEGYGTKFCDEVDVRIVDDADELEISLDGEAVAAYTNPGTTSANGTFVATFKSNERGLHTVTVVDKHGNKTVKTFEIKGGHTYRNYTTAANCTEDGSRFDLCTVCGFKTNEVVIPAIGHKYIDNYIDKDASCTVNGDRTYVCENNCGEKLVLKPTDTAEKVAQAKKLDENGEYVALTVADLAHLKATGVHTYAKVKDAEGNDTAADAWIIDSTATCKVPGSKHKDCTKCGHTETETIPVDEVNGHKFYREKVEKDNEPRCQEIGKKTKTCRYCGYVETTGYIDALGHVAGKYVTLKAATCTEAGSEMLTCSVCECYIGEGEYDPMKAPVAKVIEPLGHKWVINGKEYSEMVEQDGETIEVWYQNYKCSRCDATDKRKLDGYKPPVEVTVTFDFNGGSYTIPAVGNPNQLGYVPEMIKGTQSIKAYVGESIAQADVEKAFKLENDTYTYTFSHWEDAEGNAVKFPIEVKGDATYYAVYNEKFVNYTITYYIENINAAGGVEYKEYKKTGYLHNGEEVELAAGPSKAETSLVTYKFAGWKVKDSNPEVTYTDKATINGANINLVAKYETVKKMFAVTYAYSKDRIIHTYTVEAGLEAPDARNDFEIENKDNDTKYHYEFKGWNKADQLVSVESNIYTTPIFEKALHYCEKDDTRTIPATCTEKAVYTYVCECGYSYTVKGDALGHLFDGEPDYDETTGKNTVTCSRDDCDVTQEDTRTFTAKFFINAEDTEATKTASYLPWGSIIDSTRLPAPPTKEDDSSNTYTFSHWVIKGTTTKVDFATLEIKQDYEFVAVFTATPKKYNVSFVYDASHPIYTVTDVTAGSDVEYDEETYGIPVKAPDKNYHYSFKGWNLATTNVQSNLTVYAEFNATKHITTNKTVISQASCTTGKGILNWCDCDNNGDYTDGFDYSYITGEGLPAGHKWFETDDRKDATETTDGYVVKECSVCHITDKVTIPAQTTSVNVTVTVDRNGVAAPNIQVIVQAIGEDATKDASTNVNGIAKITVEKGKDYSAWVVIDGTQIPVVLSKDSSGNFNGYYSIKVADKDDSTCGCACHRTNFWGTIFRFFHKIIKLFTGEFKCCTNPDPMYG